MIAHKLGDRDARKRENGPCIPWNFKGAIDNFKRLAYPQTFITRPSSSPPSKYPTLTVLVVCLHHDLDAFVYLLRHKQRNTLEEDGLLKAAGISKLMVVSDLL